MTQAMQDDIFHDAATFETQSTEIIAQFQRSWRKLIVLLALLVGLDALGFFSGFLPDVIAIGCGIVLVLVGLFGRGYLYRPVMNFRRSVKVEFGNRLLRRYSEDLSIDPHGCKQSVFRHDLDGAVPQFDNYHSEDLIEGHYHGTPIRFYEVRLTEEQEENSTDSEGHATTTKKTVDVFRGYVVSIGLDRGIKGRITILADSMISKVFGQSRVRLESTDFENLSDVHADDQIQSRKLLTPVFMEKLSALALDPSLRGGKNASVKMGFRPKSAFQATVRDDFIHLLIPSTADKFEVYDDGTKVMLTEFAEAFERDMAAITTCVDGLKQAA